VAAGAATTQDVTSTGLVQPAPTLYFLGDIPVSLFMGDKPVLAVYYEPVP
jgi:hypothetical protein